MFSKLHVDKLDFFHSITKDGKKVFLKKLCLKTKKEVYYWTVLFDNCYFGLIIRSNNADIDFYRFF